MPQAISDDALQQLIKDYITRSPSMSGSNLSRNWEQATNYYLGRINGRETEDGLSDQLSGDVADMADAICSEIAINLLSGETLVEIEPDGDEDKLGAQVETTVVNKVIFDQNMGYEVLSNAVQSAVLKKTGIIHVDAQQIEKPRTRFVGTVSGEEKRILEGETDGTVDNDGYLTWTETEKRVVLRHVARENFITEHEYPNWTIDGSQFCAERMYYTKADLVALGYKWEDVRALQHVNTVNRDEVTQSYPDRNEQSRRSGHEELELVETYWCYVQLPMTGHTTRLHKIHFGGGIHNGVILDSEPADFVGFAAARMIPVAGRFDGVSIHDRIKPIEDGMTYALRQWENNLAVSNFPEIVVGPGASGKDRERIPGGELETDVMGDIMPLPTQDLGSNSNAYLDYMAGKRSERGGSAMDMQRPDSQLLRGQNQVGSMGVGMLLGAAELRSAWYARNIAETLFRQLFLLVHQALTRYEVDPIGAWVADQFVQVDPRNFRPRKSVNVRAGMSSSERVRKVQSLDASIQYQLQSAQIAGPGVLSSLAGLHTAFMERDRAAGLDNPQRWWLDPQGPQSLEAQENNAQSGREQQQMAQQLEAAKGQLEEQKLQLQKYEHDTELEWKYFDTRSDNEQKEAATTADSIVKLRQIEKGNETGGEGEGAGQGANGRGDQAGGQSA